MASTSASVPEMPFSAMGLDDRILEAISDLGWSKPTLIQEKGIPLALEGKDILAKARTGSGKSAVFLIPIIQRLLDLGKTAKCHGGRRSASALVIVPTKELAGQVTKQLGQLSKYCNKDIVAVNLAQLTDTSKNWLSALPLALDVVVGTPSGALQLAKHDKALPSQLKLLVIDEADMVLSLGYETEMKELLKKISRSCQSFLTSATLSEEVNMLKRLVLHNPVTLKLKEAMLPSQEQLMQFYIKCAPDDKFLLLYALIKLQLLRGKTIIFVNDVDRCYRVKLFLQQFGIQACVLNGELPANSRAYVINQFNEGVYTYVIAADEKDVEQVSKKKRKRKIDTESGVARGVDFHNIANVVNFDFPVSPDAYIHRIGRTARGSAQGTSLSLAAPQEQSTLDEAMRSIDNHLGVEGVIRPYNFDMNDLEGFRYRANDALKAVSRSAVKEARIEEIKRDILASAKLKKFLSKNERDLNVLRHDVSLHAVRSQPHLKHVPEYILPPALRGQILETTSAKVNRVKRQKMRGNLPPAHRKERGIKSKDPLRSFHFDDSD